MHFILILESLSHRSRFIPKNCGISTGENSTGGISTNKENLGGISTSKISTGGISTGEKSTSGISTSKNSTGEKSTGANIHQQELHRQNIHRRNTKKASPKRCFFIFRCRSVFIRDLHYDKIADLFYAALLRIDGHFFDLFASFQFFVFS